MTNNLNINQPSLTKCFNCKKKSMILTDCRCGNKYCLKCRYSEDHNCDFDFKKHASIELSKNNPLLVAKKISKI